MNYYNEQDGLKYELQCRCNGATPLGSSRRELPKNGNQLIEAFHSIEERMNKEWHPQVTLGAAAAGDGVLTDHGVNHVQDVMRHAFDIIADVKQLTGYEIYILLLAIHFHDVGNIYGREEHEQKIADIIDEMDGQLPLSTPEKDLICNIATAHGGYCNGEKDTIKNITSDCKFDNVLIRPKVLAAILRFADEISDDLGRSFFNIKIPPENEAYHEYSKSLEPVSINGDTLILRYRIPYELTQRKVQKGDQSVFLYDEIQNRLGKCMRELEYCKKYAGDMIKLFSLSVTIDILREGSFQSIKGAKDFFKLTLQGYPDEQLYSFELYREKCDNVTGQKKELKYKDGEDLKQKISKEVE